MARPGLQQVVLDDFRPGIYDDWQANGGAMAAPQGAAQRTGTYGCISDPGGGLQAGPKRVNRILETLIDTAGAGRYPTNNDRVHVTAMRVASPVWDRSAVATAFMSGDPNPFPDLLAFGFDWYYNSSGTPWKHRMMVRLYKMFLAAAANPAQGALTTYTPVNLTSTQTSTSKFFNGWTGIDISRSNTLSSINMGYPVIAIGVTDNKEVTTYARVIYPDDQAGSTDSTRAMAGLDQPGGFAAYGIFAHQDRIVALDRSVNFVFGANGESPTDMLIATAVNDVSTVGVTLSNFVAENPGLFGAWCSVNASEVFFVKQQRGGYVLRGDISFPTVVRLPGLAPTGDAINIPCVGFDGNVYYGTKDGLYAWGGGDTSINVAAPLSGWFWKIDGGTNGYDGVDTFLHAKGTFAAIRQYIAAPNNFLYDTTTKGWWRLTNPSGSGERPYCHYDTSAAGYLIGAPAYFDANTQTLADYYDFEQGQQAFSWKSQPLKVSLNRELDFRECDIVCQGAGTITVTVTGISGATSTATFTINSTSAPVTISKGLGVHCHDATVTIASDSGSSSVPAPRVYRVALGYHDRQTASG